MEHVTSGSTSERNRPNWPRVLIALLAGLVIVQWSFGIGPFLDWIRPNATEAETYLVIKGITFAWIALVVMRSVGWAGVGMRRPVRLGSVLYGAPVLLLGAAALTQGVAPTMTPAALAITGVWVMLGVLVEEIILRGALWEAVAERGHMFAAITTSLGFGMIHGLGFGGEVPASIVAAQMFFAVGTGLVLAAVRIAAGTLWTAIGVHWAFNMMSFAASGGVAETLSPGMEVRILSAGVVLGLLGLGGVVLASRRVASRGMTGGGFGGEMPVGEVG